MFGKPVPILGEHPVLAWLALGPAAIAIGILLWFLLRRPPLESRVKAILFLGFGVFPIGAALAGNIIGFEHSAQRHFCGSCHVMLPYTNDSSNPKSHTLAAVHAHNAWFGSKNCYVCHRDYGMFGTAVTKLGGLRHLWQYYTKYHQMTNEEALKRIHLYTPFDNASCGHCHAEDGPAWRSTPEHVALAAQIEANVVGCASAGCHGPAHPFSKQGRAAREGP